MTTRPLGPLTCRLSSLLTLAVLALAAGCGSSGSSHDGGSHDGGSDSGGSGGHAGMDGGAAGGGTDGGSDTTMACAVGGTGMLVVAVQGLPAGVTMPMVRLSGGGLAMPMMLTVGTPVSVAARGGYSVEYRRVKVAPAPGAIVGKAFYVSASSFDGCVKTDATTTATLTYTQEPGSEHLWIGVSNAPTAANELGGYASADITATNPPTTPKNPMIWKTNHFTGKPGAGAFDSSGNFWVPGGDVVNMYAMMTLATSGDAPPDVALTQPAAAPATFAAFDSDGSLWVSRGAPANSVVRYSLADQAASGAPTPAVSLTSPDLSNPAGLAFDMNGNLWVASEANDKVLAFSRLHLTASFTGAADVALTASVTLPVAGTYTAPNGIAFDQAGTLWVGYSGKLVGFKTAQQASSGNVADPLALNVSTGEGGFAFDESGGLWTAGAQPNTFARYPKTALGTSGDATPDILITSDQLGYAESLVLDPSPTWSPLQDQL
jgi:hypothetical protein